jgi:hypothetical protein
MLAHHFAITNREAPSKVTHILLVIARAWLKVAQNCSAVSVAPILDNHFHQTSDNTRQHYSQYVVFKGQILLFLLETGCLTKNVQDWMKFEASRSNTLEHYP